LMKVQTTLAEGELLIRERRLIILAPAGTVVFFQG